MSTRDTLEHTFLSSSDIGQMEKRRVSHKRQISHPSLYRLTSTDDSSEGWDAIAEAIGRSGDLRAEFEDISEYDVSNGETVDIEQSSDSVIFSEDLNTIALVETMLEKL